MFLGVEIGGTKIQLAVGRGDGSPPLAQERFSVEPAAGATGILDRVAEIGTRLIGEHRPRRVGIGFGGPVDTDGGTVIKSHHVAGWDDFPLVEWCHDTWRLPAIVANDADTAALAEAHFGAGKGCNPVFYVTIGTGIGGGLIVDGRIYRGAGNAAAELGHLRPGMSAERPEQHLESYAAGWGIAAAAQERVAGPIAHKFRLHERRPRPKKAEEVRQRLIDIEDATERDVADLLQRAEGDTSRITAKLVGEAAICGNRLAREVLDRAWQALGWGIAQAITLVSPEVVVIGGGVSLLGETWCLGPLRRQVARYVFPPLADTYRLVPAKLGERVVLDGALALAADAGDR